ncbi:MAG TPA: AAA-like domain-containing protein [Anaerolineales bacterium]|nr:AAA-like domain-containing protein [Anaerolineales bacterium]HLO31397.1 AAA-like domain-containing protein [Anaerolineales bacterium]
MSVPRVFISYSHDSPQHEELVLSFSNRLRADGVDAFLDQYVESPPEGWPLWMEKQIRDADFVLMICTKTYLKRVMNEEQPGRGLGVRWEATISYQHLYNAGSINTKFIPIVFEEACLSYIPKPLQATTYYLLTSEDAYKALYRHITGQFPSMPELGEVKKLTDDGDQRTTLLAFAPSGPTTSNEEITNYVARKQDKELFRELKQTGVTLTIKGPRKTGKSLLLTHTLARAGKKFIYIDLKAIDDHVFDQIDAFYAVFCEIIASGFGVNSRLRQSWKRNISAPQQVTAFIEDHLFELMNEPLVIAIDHADHLVGSDLSVDFFPMLRGWHNSRFKGIGWENTTLVIVISTDPRLIINNDRESPFNVGTIIHLDDFSYEELIKLNSLYKNQLSAANLYQLHKMLNGHPYLTKLALDAISNKLIEPSELLHSPLGAHSPFTEYLQSVWLRIVANHELIQALQQMSRHESMKEQNVNALLRAGIIRLVNGQPGFRNDLYRLYFQERL